MKKLVYFLIVGLAFTAPQVAHSDPMKELPPVSLERDGRTLRQLIKGPWAFQHIFQYFKPTSQVFDPLKS